MVSGASLLGMLAALQAAPAPLLADASCARVHEGHSVDAQPCDSSTPAALGFGAVHVIRNMEDTRFKQVGSRRKACSW